MRARVLVRWNWWGHGWMALEAAGKRLFDKKPDAVAQAVRWAKRSAPSELTIYKRNGQIQDRRSYGTDPTRSKG